MKRLGDKDLEMTDPTELPVTAQLKHPVFKLQAVIRQAELVIKRINYRVYNMEYMVHAYEQT